MERISEEFTANFMILSKYFLCVRYDVHVCTCTCRIIVLLRSVNMYSNELLSWRVLPFKVAYCNFESVYKAAQLSTFL